MPAHRVALALVLAAASLALPAAVRAGGRMQPGLWEVTAAVEVPGMTSSPPATSQTECLSQADVDADPVPEIDKGVCHVANVRRAGDKVTWSVDCGQLGKGQGELVYRSPTTYDGWMTLETGGMVLRTAIRGRRVGAC